MSSPAGHGPYAPIVELADGRVYPPPLSTLNDEAFALYDAVLKIPLPNPSVCSRLADLLWVRKWSERPDLYARQAIHAYMELAPAEKLEFENVLALQRALAIAREINDADTEKPITSAIVAAISQELGEKDLRPGISLSLLETLMRLPRAKIPNEIDELLELAFKVYEDNSWILESLYDLKASRCPSDELRDLRTVQVDKWLAEAEGGKVKRHRTLSELGACTRAGPKLRFGRSRRADST